MSQKWGKQPSLQTWNKVTVKTNSRNKNIESTQTLNVTS